MKRNPCQITILIIVAFSLAACGNSHVASIAREDLFTLHIGPMEDQIALYSLDGTRGIRRTGFAMREGQFYIADGNSGKIVRYNSYGDLLFMIYNEETNPPPVSLPANVPAGEQVTRWAHAYPLEETGWITVDSRKHIYVEDRVPPGSRRTDPETRAALDGIILHFDQGGQFVHYLGREGIGGSPFPRIVGLAASARDDLAVICRLPDGWDVYWFNASGALLYVVKVSTNQIPMIADWPEALGVIDSIMVSPDARELFVKVDYSHDTFDQSTNTRTGAEPIISVIWVLNIEDGSYSRYVEIQLFEIVEASRPAVKVFYSMLGVAQGGKALLYFPVEAGYSLLFVDTKTREQRRGTINFSISEIIYNDFYLSTEGILSAMLADRDSIKLTWWRTDRFIGEAP